MDKVLAKSNFSIRKILSAVKERGILSEDDIQLILEALASIDNLFPILPTNTVLQLVPKIEELSQQKHLMILVAAERLLPSYWENMDYFEEKFDSKEFLLNFSHDIDDDPNMARIRLVMAAILSLLEPRQKTKQVS